MWGPFTAYCYKSILDGIEHIAMVKVRAMLKKHLLLILIQNIRGFSQNPFVCGRERLVTVKTF